MLPTAYKFYVYNACGQTIASSAIVIDIVPWKFDSNGAVSYGTEVSKTNASTLATANGVDIGSTPEISNATDKNIGAHVRCSITSPASASGMVSVYLRKSHDGTDYEDATKHLIAAFDMGASETQIQTVEI